MVRRHTFNKSLPSCREFRVSGRDPVDDGDGAPEVDDGGHGAALLPATAHRSHPNLNKHGSGLAPEGQGSVYLHCIAEKDAENQNRVAENQRVSNGSPDECLYGEETTSFE